MKPSMSGDNNNGELLYIELKHLTRDAENKVNLAKKKLSRYFSNTGGKTLKYVKL